MSDLKFPQNLASLLEEFVRSGLREVHIRKGDFELYLSTSAASGPTTRSPAIARATPAEQPRPSDLRPAAQQPAASGSIPEGAIVVSAPNLGTFYRSPKPGTPPFVEVGQRVAAGDELCLIEVMKLFTALRCEVTGTLAAALVEDGAMVEAGQPLFAVMPD